MTGQDTDLDLLLRRLQNVPLAAAALEISLVWNWRLPSVRKKSDKVLKLLGTKFRF
jgi:hypothetical protein